MSKWLNKFLDTGPRNSTDNTDRFKSDTNMSVLSVHPQGHLDQNLENISRISTDNTDRFDLRPNMSVLSVLPQGALNQNLVNVSGIITDKPDKFDLKPNMSVLSVPPEDPFDRNLGNMSETRTDKTDKSDLSVLSGSIYDSFTEHSILETFEERIAIAEYDGHQNSDQAQRIAYQDAFITVLNALPYEDKEGADWFEKRIKVAKEWLLGQGIRQSE